MKQQTKEALATVATVIVLLAGLIAIPMVGWPLYNVWRKEQSGKAALSEAEHSKLVQIEEAKANLESEKFNALAEVERAKGAAEAIRIEGGKLTEKSRRDPERDERIRRLWEKGVATEQIGKEVELTAQQVRSVVQHLRDRHKMPVSPRGLPKGDSRERYKLIAGLVRLGRTNAEIAAELGTTARSVSQMIYRARRLGFDMPYRSEVAP